MELTQKFLPRSAGILLHPTSLPTPYGIGDFGPSAISFIQYLKKAGQSYWQILPFGPTGYADSPYQGISAFAGNPLLISPDGIIQIGLLDREEIGNEIGEFNHILSQKGIPKVEFEKVRKWKYQIFLKAYHTFQKNLEDFSDYRRKFQTFCKKEAYWLDQFVLFYSLRKNFNFQSWVDWPEEYSQHDESAIQEWITNHNEELQYYKFIQWLFDFQWQQLRNYAHRNKIQFIGDMPIFVAHDSVDVWANKELFTLNSNGTLEFQAGVPPDYFSKTGQLWGNPLYKWEVLKKTNFSWFIQRFQRTLELLDWVRVDHFRGFEAYWRVDGSAKTAINGKWIKAPGKELFLKINEKLGAIPIIAEDLGIITPEVEKLRDEFHFPGMKVLQFAFAGDDTNPHLPHNYLHNSIVYTGTHDNDTTLGWWVNSATKIEKEFFKEYFASEGINIVPDLIKAAYRSIANLAILPLQDVLGQNSDSRMNTPSVPQGNWQYLLKYSDLSEDRADWLKKEVERYSRNHFKKNNN